jgi:hypothetical protein
MSSKNGWGVDCIWWTPSKRKIFELRFFFFFFPYSGWTRWGSLLSHGRVCGELKVLLRVSFFVWMATLGKILTMDNLHKRGFIVVD